jgi:hypothetical protein
MAILKPPHPHKERRRNGEKREKGQPKKRAKNSLFFVG